MGKLGFIISVIVLSICWILIVKAIEEMYEYSAVKHQCAKYNPQTAKFEWIEEK